MIKQPKVYSMRPTYNLKFFVALAMAVQIILTFHGCYPKKVGPVTAEGDRLAWIEMSFEQRKAHMRKAVLPRAAAILQAWRPERFARINCTLCHGEGLNTGSFQMPTAYLPRLSGYLLLGPEFKKHPETTRLKLNRLVPEIADALGLKTFSIVTRNGFGCYSCHLGPTGPMFGN